MAILVIRLYSDTVPLMADDIRQAESDDPSCIKKNWTRLYSVLMKSMSLTAKWFSQTSQCFVQLNGLHS